MLIHTNFKTITYLPKTICEGKITLNMLMKIKVIIT